MAKKEKKNFYDFSKLNWDGNLPIMICLPEKNKPKTKKKKRGC